MRRVLALDQGEIPVAPARLTLAALLVCLLAAAPVGLLAGCESSSPHRTEPAAPAPERPSEPAAQAPARPAESAAQAPAHQPEPAAQAPEPRDTNRAARVPDNGAGDSESATRALPNANSKTEVVPPAEPATPEVNAPDFVTILEVEEPTKPARVTAELQRGNRLVLETRNVRRLRIDRAGAGVDVRTSVSLQLDAQGLEWLARSDVDEFERSAMGFWIPANSRPIDRPRPAPGR